MIPLICHCDRITGIFFTLVRVKSQFCDRISGLRAIRKRIVFNKSASLLRYDPVLSNEQRSLIDFIPNIHAGLADFKISPLVIYFLTAYPEYSVDAWNTEASGFMVKPITLEGVMAQLKKLRHPFPTGGTGL